MQKWSGRVAKFMPHWDGPYNVLEAFPEILTYKLALPPPASRFTTFHVSLLKRHIENNDELFPGRWMEKSGPIVMPKGSTEYFMDKILDEQPRGQGKQYLVPCAVERLWTGDRFVATKIRDVGDRGT